MSTHLETQPKRERSVIATVVIVVLVVLAVIATIFFVNARQESKGVEKAQQLIDAYGKAGISLRLTPEQIARVLGNDGGATCADPNAALARATLLEGLANGAGGPGTRPALVQSQLLKGQLLIIQTYCPKEADQFQKFVDSLNTVKVGS
ncbi:hypothetical protein HII28_03140 [Planctomonas sp. JC2975]|nr:hypothetical protein [Planctomonas sp. JC2975]